MLTPFSYGWKARAVTPRVSIRLGSLLPRQSLLAIALLAVSHKAAPAESNAGVSLSFQERVSVAQASGDYAQVIALTDRVLDVDPQHTDALVFRGFAHLATGDLDAAERDFRTTLQLAPDYLDATLGLAYVNLRRGDTATAETLAREVVDADDGYADAHELLALVQRPASSKRPRASSVPSSASRSETDAAAKPAASLRTFAVDGRQAWGDREESELTLTFADSELDGWRIVYTLRHTKLRSGDASQLRFQGFWTYSAYTLGGELALGAGADNLPKFRIGASVVKSLKNGFELGTEVRWESFASSRIATVIPIATYSFGSERGSLSLRAPTSLSSETTGFATTIDARLRLPLGERLHLGLSHVAGEEFDAATKRDVRSTSIGLIGDVRRGLRVAATLSDGPYADTNQTNLNAAVVWRF